MKHIKLFESFNNEEIEDLQQVHNSQLLDFIKKKVSNIKKEIDNCLMVLIDEYDLVPENPYPEDGSCENAIIAKSRNNVGNISSFKHWINHFCYIIEDGKVAVDRALIKELTRANAKLGEINLYMSFEYYNLIDVDGTDYSSPTNDETEFDDFIQYLANFDVQKKFLRADYDNRITVDNTLYINRLRVRIDEIGPFKSY